MAHGLNTPLYEINSTGGTISRVLLLRFWFVPTRSVCMSLLAHGKNTLFACLVSLCFLFSFGKETKEEDFFFMNKYNVVEV